MGAAWPILYWGCRVPACVPQLLSDRYATELLMDVEIALTRENFHNIVWTLRDTAVRYLKCAFNNVVLHPWNFVICSPFTNSGGPRIMPKVW